MNQLKDGYVVDVPYPTFVHKQAMPLWMTVIVQQQGFHAPNIDRPFRYLELGCAMGIHLHLTAAAHPNGHFVGVDFNPQQLLVAQEGIERTDISNIEFIQASFDEILDLDLESFDFIVTHGVWSWINDQYQQSITDIVDQLLKPGGIFYCSYMSHPGATHFSSIQKLMVEMARNLQGDSNTKAVQTLHFARQLAQHDVGLFQKVPSLKQDLSALAQDKPSYIAHDFLSQHWQPQHSADMIRRFGSIQMAYTAGAGIIENMDSLSLPPALKKIIDQLPLVTLQETAKDIARNTLQRQDLYIKNRTKPEPDTGFQNVQFRLMPKAPVGQSLAHDPKIGMINDVIEICEKILSALAETPWSVKALFNHLKLNMTLSQFGEIMMLLMWAGYIHPTTTQIDHIVVSKMNQWMQEQQLNWRVFAECATVIEP